MTKNINWVKFTVLTIFELFLGYVMFSLYPLISMLFFGEGASSYLYTKSNGFLWALSPLIILLFNVFYISNPNNSENVRMTNTFKFISIIYSIVYLFFILFWFNLRGFKI